VSGSDNSTDRPDQPGKDSFPGRIDRQTIGEDGERMHAWLLAILAAGRYHGVELDPAAVRIDDAEATPSPAALVEWIRDSGMWAKAVRMSWRQLVRLDGTAPVVLLLSDGGAGLMVGVDPVRNVVLLKDPRAPQSDPPVEVDELRLSQVWRGEALLIRAERSETEDDAPFTMGLLFKMVMRERKIMRDIGVASVTLTVLTILPILLVMTVVDQVLAHHNMSTLVLVTAIIIVAVLFETLIDFAKGIAVVVLATRLDARLNLLIFRRLLRLPLTFFEKVPSGEVGYRIGQIYRVRSFLTGRLLSTFIDLSMLLLLLPLMFYMNATLSWAVLAAATLIALIIAAFLHPIRVLSGRQAAAESAKAGVMIETVYGIRTVKSLAIEPQRNTAWDAEVANASDLAMRAGKLANWPQVLVKPLQRFIQVGVILLGAYIALTSNNAMAVGGLFAFTMLAMRVSGPLVGFAQLMQDFEEVRAAMGMVTGIMNHAPEIRGLDRGVRPRFEGAIVFDSVSFTYDGSKTPALDEVSFSVPAGTMLGVVGRSGSGKSTITRLLQGINRDYDGFVKIDGIDLRAVNLRHLRQSFGVVMQDNFLFRGTVRDNIIAGRPGLTLDDAVRAARLAGAEEFIERLPQGFETFIQEGSSNLSGGQKQRLAIARALITDPRLLIMDEATSALDPESEALVNANLQRIGHGRTMMIVSHRLSSLTECDLIMVMERGRVLDIAPHKELVERCAVYRHLWQQQNRHLEPPAHRQGPTPMLAHGDD